MFKKNKRRGVAMVEYAVLLALICSVSVVFLDGKGSGSIYKAIDNIIHNVYDTYEGRNLSLADWSARAKSVHDNPATKVALTDIFEGIEGGADKAFSALTDDQKWALRNVGLCVDEVEAGAFYKENGCWYVAWTTPSTTNPDNINYMVYAFSAGGIIGTQTEVNGTTKYDLCNGKYYVGTTTNTKEANPVTAHTSYGSFDSNSSVQKFETTDSAGALAAYKALE